MSSPFSPGSPNLNEMPPKQALMTLRIIWAALVLGQLMFLAIIIFVILPQQTQSVHPQPVLVWANVIMAVTMIPITFLIRSLVFRRSQAQGGLRPAAYATGNIIFWAGCEGNSFFALVIAVVSGSLWPTILIAAIAMGLQALTFPTAARLDA